MSDAREGAPDARALRILFDTHWSAAGWRPQFRTDPNDLAYAIAAGVMFPPEQPAAVTHDAVAERVRAAARATDERRVAAAFLASLTSRRPALRSALATDAVARRFPVHERASHQSFGCALCGYAGRPRDRNVLSFERHKWGGVAHLDPHYCAFDLEQFALSGVPTPSTEDAAVFRRVLDVARSLPASARVRDLERSIAPLLASNKAEREVLLGTLGTCGILVAPGHPGFEDTWVPPGARDLPPAPKIDWAYPVAWWRGGGVSDANVQAIFGNLLD